MITVLLVDDHEVVRAGIKRLLLDFKDVEVVAVAASGEDAIALAKEKQPKVVLMDVKMPGIGGLEATRKIVRACPNTKVLVLSSYDEEVYPIQFLKCGASGYLVKTCSPKDLYHAISKVIMGQRSLSPALAEQLALKRFENDQSPFEGLSERELQITLMIIEGQRPKNIAESLFLSPKTVNTYRYRVFEKLGIANDVELTRLALEHGLIE